MSKTCKTFLTSLQKSGKGYLPTLFHFKINKRLLMQNGNIRNFGTIQRLTKNAKVVSSVNLCQRRYCCNEQHIVKSPFGDIDIPDLKLHEYIWESIGPWEDKTAMQCALTGRKYTYSQARKLSNTIAASLQNKFNMKKGDCFGIILPNLPEYPILFLAGSQAGLIITTLNPIYTADEIAKQLLDSNAKLVFTLPELFPVVSSALQIIKKDLPIVVVKLKEDSPIPTGAVAYSELTDESTSGDFQRVEISNQDTLVLPYSSGTTGKPKGVELTHRNIVANVHQLDHPGPRLLRHTTKDEQDAVLALLPLFHIYGMVVVTYTCMKAGGKLVTVPKFDPTLLIETLVKHQINIGYLVPPLVLFLANHPSVKPEHLTSVRHVLSGAAPCGFSDIERLQAKAKNTQIGQGYGMTETSPCVLSSHKERYHKYASTGVPVPSTMLKIVDVDTGNSQPAGKIGELRIKGPQVMKGYFKQPEANKEIFDHHGWLRTGDLGYYDEDGDFYVVDRLKELIKVKGFQVAPAELEEILRTHPKIIDAAVIGVKNEETGELPKAFVVVKPGEKASEDEVKDFVKGKVTKFKRLEGGVVFLDTIPKSSAGKILRKELKAKYGS